MAKEKQTVKITFTLTPEESLQLKEKIAHSKYLITANYIRHILGFSTNESAEKAIRTKLKEIKKFANDPQFQAFLNNDKHNDHKNKPTTNLKNKSSHANKHHSQTINDLTASALDEKTASKANISAQHAQNHSALTSKKDSNNHEQTIPHDKHLNHLISEVNIKMPNFNHTHNALTKATNNDYLTNKNMNNLSFAKLKDENEVNKVNKVTDKNDKNKVKDEVLTEKLDQKLDQKSKEPKVNKNNASDASDDQIVTKEITKKTIIANGKIIKSEVAEVQSEVNSDDTASPTKKNHNNNNKATHAKKEQKSQSSQLSQSIDKKRVDGTLSAKDSSEAKTIVTDPNKLKATKEQMPIIVQKIQVKYDLDQREAKYWCDKVTAAFQRQHANQKPTLSQIITWIEYKDNAGHLRQAYAALQTN